jgi:hypothetical protein
METIQPRCLGHVQSLRESVDLKDGFHLQACRNCMVEITDRGSSGARLVVEVLARSQSAGANGLCFADCRSQNPIVLPVVYEFGPNVLSSYQDIK